MEKLEQQPVVARLTQEQHRMLHQLARDDGRSLSGCVRQLIERAYRSAYGDAKPPKVKHR